jgi:hypothetical protein
MNLFVLLAAVIAVLTSLVSSASAQTPCTSGSWGGFWTWDAVNWRWFWTWVWTPCTGSWNASAEREEPPAVGNVNLSTVLGIAGGVFAGVVAVVTASVIFIRRRRAALANATNNIDSTDIE